MHLPEDTGDQFCAFLRSVRGEKQHAHRTDQQKDKDESQDAAKYAAVIHDNLPQERAGKPGTWEPDIT
jgi:hypothetical protein